MCNKAKKFGIYSWETNFGYPTRKHKEAIKKFDIFDLSVIHRFGEIQIADDIVLIIAIAEHRKAAFEACEWAIDELKRTVPIWKKEITTDGDVWVEDHP